MNNIIVSTLILALIIGVSNYEFSTIKMSQAKLYDFLFEDFLLQSISKNGKDLYIQSKNGKIKNKSIEFNEVSIIRKNHKTLTTEHIYAGNMIKNGENITFRNNIYYKVDNTSIHSRELNYEMQNKIITAKDSVVSFDKNRIKSKQMSFDITNKNFIANDIKAKIDIKNNLSI